MEGHRLEVVKWLFEFFLVKCGLVLALSVCLNHIEFLRAKSLQILKGLSHEMEGGGCYISIESSF